MFGCDCLCWGTVSSETDLCPFEPEPFYLPSPIPIWPQGEGYAEGRICVGEIDVMKVTAFDMIWNSKRAKGAAESVSFYRPAEIPEGYFSLGHYCQLNCQPLRGYLLVARDLMLVGCESNFRALSEPLDYTLIWNMDSDASCCYVWLPIPQEGYKATGFIVTNNHEKPGLDMVRCVRADLTEACETEDMIFEYKSKHFPKKSSTLRVWNMRPSKRGMFDLGISVGTFFCTSTTSHTSEDTIVCLKNLESNLIKAMPNETQVHSIIQHYGPRVFFHPEEVYMPSSVQWFFENGARVFSLRNENKNGELIDRDGSNLPAYGANDGEYWIDLPTEEGKRDFLKKGNLESAKLYVHVKPALGGTFTDIAMWVFCPFNGPATLKASLVNIEMSKLGEHVGDWEHFSLRVSNFNGELWSVYLSQHSGGGWVDASQLEFLEGEGNRPVVYSSKSGHACFPHKGCYIQGTTKFGIGLRNDTAKSKYYIDSNIRYQIIAAEYLGDGVVREPPWLQYMREWGPRVVYDTWAEIDKIMSHFPIFIRLSADVLFELFPTEIYGEEGPTGPKEKDNWFGDERC